MDQESPPSSRTADAPTGTVGGARRREPSEVLASLAANLQALLRTEIELAKLELKRVARDKAVAVVLLGAAGLLGIFVLAFLGVTGAQLLALALPAWAGWAIVTGVYLLVAGVLGLVAVRLLKRPVSPETTRREAVTTWGWAKEQVQR